MRGGAPIEPLPEPVLPPDDWDDDLDIVDGAFTSAWELYRSGDYAGAVDALRDVVDMDPEHAAARYALGLAYLRTSNLAAAFTNGS